MKILLVEDDQATSKLLAATLAAHRYTVDLAADGEAGLELAKLCDYDLIMLDVSLPKLDGLSVCRQLRAQGRATPILMLTAKGSKDDVITGLDAGADDYVTKPCDPAQLMARVRVLLRRGGGIAPKATLTWNGLSLDPISMQVAYHHQTIVLRPKEYSLLELFLRHPQRLFSRSAILDHLWSVGDCPSEKAVTNLIKDLRRRLIAGGVSEDPIETVHGLGYRLKSLPNQPSTAAATLEPPDQEDTAVNENPTEISEIPSLHELFEQFWGSLEQRLAALESAAIALAAGELDWDQQQMFREEAHRLAGSLGTYGSVKGSELARQIEGLLTEDDSSATGVSDRLTQLLAELKQELGQPPNLDGVFAIPATARPLVLVIYQDVNFARLLQQEAPTWGIEVELLVVEAVAQLQARPLAPAAILIDWQTPVTEADDLTLVETLKAQFPGVPLLALADQDNLADRIQASRLGCDRYLLKPMTPAQAFEAITQLLPQIEPPEAKVLIVDDDPVMLSTLAALLQPWGVQTTCLMQPGQFWEVLNQVHPDLLLLDLAMPTFNGIDLCRVVRQDAKYGDLPILVVTAHHDLAHVQQVFEAGADDLIPKPIVGPELVTRVISRLERSRLRHQLDQLRQWQNQVLQRQVSTDSLTQIANRREFDQYLLREWQKHLQDQTTLSLILGDVDHFKRYNDRYGHLEGDNCLRQLAAAIQNCLKPSDLVARYGGEEFGLILPLTDLNGALRVVERIQEAIAQLRIPHSDSPICPHVTISLGVTGTVPTPVKTIPDFIATADQALYAAKRRGRNT